MDFTFVLNSMLLGVGLSMDAFALSLANGLKEPKMPLRKQLLIAGTFAFFQALMPLTGWFCVRMLVQLFAKVEPFIPWIAFGLLCFLGIRMIREGIEGGENSVSVGAGALLVQGIATSLDALSVGFTISEYGWQMALVCALIIAAVTMVICVAGVKIGRTAGVRLAGRASIFGGAILITIGLEILLTHLL